MAGDDAGTSSSISELTIVRASTSEQVAKAVREAILGGQLAPGTPLRENALASSIGISRNTVREAIKVLVREGLVTHHMHRGAEVTRLSEADVADIFEVRRVLELQAVKATGGRDDAELRPLRETVEELTAAVDSRDFERITASDVAFHQCLVGFLESPRIDRFFDAIQAELRLCVSIVDRQEDDPTPLIAEHRELYELMESGRQSECAARMSQHLSDAERMLRAVARRSELQAAEDARDIDSEGDPSPLDVGERTRR